MTIVNITPGPDGFGVGFSLPVGSGKKVVSLTGREIHPVAAKIGRLAQAEIVNGFQGVPPDEEILCVIINCGGSLRCGLYPKKGVMTINVLSTGQAGPLAQYINETNYVSDVSEASVVAVASEEAIAAPAAALHGDDTAPPDATAATVATQPFSLGHTNRLMALIEKVANGVGYVIALLFASSREAVDVSIRTIIPFMAFVSVLIAIVQVTSLGNIIAHGLTPLANSIWGLLLISVICGIPFLSPILGPGAAISQVVGVMIGTLIGSGAVSPAFALPALFAINVQVGCDFVPVGLSMQEAKPETIAQGVPAFLLSRQITGPLAVLIGWLFSFNLF